MLKLYQITALVGLFFLISFSVVIATDPPHNDYEGVSCNSCHIPHNTLGSSLANQTTNPILCKSCHTLTGTASNWPFKDSDQANPGVSGNSHSWSGPMPATSSPLNVRGLRASADLSSALLKSRLSAFANVVTCSVCHDQHSQSNTPWDVFSFAASGGDYGTATGGAATSVVQSNKTWQTDQWKGYFVQMTGGTSANIGQVIQIATNTATQLNLAFGFPATVTSGDTYIIFGSDSGDASSGTTTTITDATKNWTADQWANSYVIMNSGTVPNLYQPKLIVSNTNDMLTISSSTPFPSVVAANDSYYITQKILGLEQGDASSGTTTTITDATKNWTTDAWANSYVIMNGGTAANLNQKKLIASNTNNTLTISTTSSNTAFTFPVAANDTYYITSSQDSGTATSGTTTTVGQTGKLWTPNEWAGYYVKMTGGLNNGLERRIQTNTMTQLTLGTGFPNAAAAGDTFYMKSNRHFMRTNNALNDMCMDCHYYRNQTDVTTYTGNPLSHPVGKSLGAVKDPSQFLVVPREPQSASFGPQTGVRGELNGGTDSNPTNNFILGLDNQISCLSCHGVHYTDSNSSTVHKP
jgi:predicted CXXCH cytochrome family protein